MLHKREVCVYLLPIAPYLCCLLVQVSRMCDVLLHGCICMESTLILRPHFYLKALSLQPLNCESLNPKHPELMLRALQKTASWQH